MKKSLLLILLTVYILISGCGNDEPKINMEPELSPICPEGFYRVDTIKSCESLVDDMSQE